jgi:hypothetical protein
MDVLEIFQAQKQVMLSVPVCARNGDAWKQGSELCGATLT